MTNDLKQICDQFRARMRRALTWLGLSRLISLALALAAGLIIVDFFWHFGHGERFVALALFLGVSVFVIVRDLIHPLRQSWSDKEVLAYLDAAPNSQDRLTNLAELAHPETIVEAASPEGHAVVEQAARQLQQELAQVEVAGAIQVRVVRRWQQWAALALVLGATVGLAGEFATREPYTSIGLQRLFLPWAQVRWPSSTWFELITPVADASVPEGEDLPIRVKVNGRAPGQVTLIYNPVDEEGVFTRREIALTMFVNTSGVAEHTFAKLGDSIRYRIEGGDGRSETITVHVVKRPFLREVAVYYKYPPYTGVPPKIVNNAQLTGLEGTEVRLAFTASVKLRKAWIQMAGTPAPVPLTLDESGKHFEWFHLLADSTTYAVGLEDEHGNREKRAETFRIQVTPDVPPQARLLEPQGDLEVTPRARFKVRYKAEDDFGLKQVRVMVSKDGAAATPLDEKITGPIPQIGKLSTGVFDWDLEKMDVAGASKLTFFLAAQDVNPTQRGKAESAHLQLNLRTELEVQSNVLLAAKALLTEALLGSSNQRWAYLDAVKWVGQAFQPDSQAGKPDLLLQQVLEEQALAERAATALQGRFKSLMDEMTRNRLEGAFFARRLERIGALIRQMAAERQPQLAKALKEARPASSAEDTPAGRTAKMRKALTALEPSQKLAVLEYQQLFEQLQDWTDLQNVLVTSKRLGELQTKVMKTSLVVGPKWIGKEIEDLTEADSRLLTTLAQQQETIRDAEGALEEELQTLALAARDQGRKHVFVPLKENLELLRLRAVNEKLIQCAKGIKDNRIDATLQDQQYVLKVFTFVANRLEQAGQEVPELAVLDLKKPIVDDRLVEKVIAKKPVTSDPAQNLVFNPESKVDVEDIGAYKINTIEQALVFLQSILDDQVMLYTQYTSQRFKESERSTRYRQLRLGMLGMRVQRAQEASSKALELAKEHPFERALPHLQTVHADLEQVHRLTAAGQIGTGTQEFVAELSANVQTTRRFLARHAGAMAQLQDREKSKGRDEFGQPFVVVGPDLATLVDMRQQLGWAVVLQEDVTHKIKRVSDYQAGKVQKEPLLDALTVQAFDVARARQAKVSELVSTVLTAKDRIAKGDLHGRVDKELLPLTKVDWQSHERSTDLVERLRTVLASLDLLADERIRPKEVLAKEVLETQKAISQVDLKKSSAEVTREIAAAREKALHDLQFEVLAEKIKKASLSPAVRDHLLQTLSTNPDPRYRMMISAYIQPLLPAPAKQKEQP